MIQNIFFLHVCRQPPSIEVNYLFLNSEKIIAVNQNVTLWIVRNGEINKKQAS